MENIRVKRNTFEKQIKSMLKVDFRRMFTSRLFYISLSICLVAPILILVMTAMMDGSVSVDPQTGKETVIEGFDNVWQIIGTLSVSGVESEAAMSMGITAICNMNLLYFGIAVLVCLFVADDFRSGYVKNLFCVRSKKTNYVVSKTIVLFVGSVFLILAFFVGSLLGGSIAGLPYTMVGFNTANLIMCLLSKIFLALVFVPLYLVVSVAAKQRSWASLLASCGAGALLFMMIPMLTPLNATAMNVLLCLIGGVLFSVGLGAVSNVILKKTDLV